MRKVDSGACRLRFYIVIIVNRFSIASAKAPASRDARWGDQNPTKKTWNLWREISLRTRADWLLQRHAAKNPKILIREAEPFDPLKSLTNSVLIPGTSYRSPEEWENRVQRCII